MESPDLLNDPEIVTDINRMMRTHSRSDLNRMCTEASLAGSGTKHDMAQRLVLARHRKIESRDCVLNRLRRQRKQIYLTQLNDGHYLYPEPNLVFHQQTRRVFCRHVGDATDGVPKQYETLRESDLEFCRQWKIPYSVPEMPVQDLEPVDECKESQTTIRETDSSDEDEDDHDDPPYKI